MTQNTMMAVPPTTGPGMALTRRPERGEQREADEDDASRRRHVARADAGRPHDPDVLAARDDEGGAEASADQRGERVAADGFRNVALRIDLLAHHVRDGDGLAGRLGHRNDAEDDKRDGSDEIKGRPPEREQRRDADDRAGFDAGKAHHAQRACNTGAEHQAEKDRKLPPQPGKEAREQHRESDGREREQNAGRVGKAWATRLSRDDPAVDLDQIDGDKDEDGADHQSGKKPQAAGKDRKNQEIADGGEDDGARRRCQVGLLRDCQEDHDRRSAGHHDERKARSETGGAEALQERSEPADQEGRADQVEGEGRRKIECPAHQECRRYRGCSITRTC